MISLITGAGGFVGPYLAEQLSKSNGAVIGLDRNKIDNDVFSKSFIADITDKNSLKTIFMDVQPDSIFHLAAQSSVRKSFQDPDLTKKVNVEGTRNILETVAELNIQPKILIVSSAEVYGNASIFPITENIELKPISPYGESRAEQERISLELSKQHNLNVVISRSFPHTGPGQSDIFVCSEFAKQLAQIEAGMQDNVIQVGNLEVKRDFTDVRDTCTAYVLLNQKGKNQEIYNVSSGKEYSVKQIDISTKMELEI